MHSLERHTHKKKSWPGLHSQRYVESLKVMTRDMTVLEVIVIDRTDERKGWEEGNLV